MKPWDFTPPPESELGDHEVPLEGTHLQGKRVALLVTGGIAAMKSPLIARALRREGADVVTFTSEEALRYVTIETLEWSTTHRVITHLTPAAEHLSDNAPFDIYLVAPATYNTINKLRYGIADGVITATLASALGKAQRGKTKVMIVPTMHGSLHNSILTESLKTLHQMGVAIMPPREDYGKHNIPDERDIVVEVCRLVSHSPLKNMRILVTGGPTPVLIDSVRRITSRFTGQLGISIAEELYLSGANVHLIHGRGTHFPPTYLPHQIVETYDEYFAQVLDKLTQKPYQCAIFSAAVADYKPDRVLPCKTPSGGILRSINLVPTAKVIEVVREKFPNLYMVTFKYQEQVSHEELMQIADERLRQGYNAVIANRGEEMGTQGEQIAYLVTKNHSPQKMIGKKDIAREMANHLKTAINAVK